MAVELLGGRYRLGPKIGEGTLSVVYRAHDTKVGRDVAVKVLRAEFAADQARCQAFLEAAQRAARLSHPNIVEVYDSGQQAGRPYLVMEYLPEPDLKQIIRRYAPLPEDKVAQMGIDCCRALEYAHRRGLVHRDVKPQNVLFTTDGTAKLSDFAVAASVGAPGMSDDGIVVGTAAYMAPEQAQGLPVMTQSDLYSLGCVLYEAVTGRPPFTGRTAEEVMRRHVQDRPTPVRRLNPEVSPSLEFIITKAMAKDPARRYRTASEMLTDLQKVAAGVELDRTGVLPGRTRPVVVEPSQAEGRRSEATRPAPGKPQWLLMSIALIFAVLLIVGVAWLTKHAFYPGEVPSLVQVPSVKGLTLHEAKQKLSKYGLEAGKVTYQESDLYEVGTVIEQRPRMGSTVEKGTEVTLVINRGKATVPMVDVRGMTLDDAITRLERAGLTLGNVERRYDDSLPKDRVIEQAVEPGTGVEKGQPIDLVVSKGKQPPPQPEPQPGVTDDTTGDTGEDADDQEAETYPDVDVQDQTPDRGPDETHTYEIRVTVLGRKPQQEIFVLAQDATGRRLDVLREKLDPQKTVRCKIELTGLSTIEVYHE
ncbi:MAG: Stk1 family PASTA domain-containing Ser/Thr kinase, partial [Armatimonadetes bacterium]|nr:Stk1 family PASTA domain-containing Ser/Thr kinase [Armatimonadota bacterium]